MQERKTIGESFRSALRNIRLRLLLRRARSQPDVWVCGECEALHPINLDDTPQTPVRPTQCHESENNRQGGDKEDEDEDEEQAEALNRRVVPEFRIASRHVQSALKLAKLSSKPRRLFGRSSSSSSSLLLPAHSRYLDRILTGVAIDGPLVSPEDIPRGRITVKDDAVVSELLRGPAYTYLAEPHVTISGRRCQFYLYTEYQITWFQLADYDRDSEDFRYYYYYGMRELHICPHLHYEAPSPTRRPLLPVPPSHPPSSSSSSSSSSSDQDQKKQTQIKTMNLIREALDYKMDDPDRIITGACSICLTDFQIDFLTYYPNRQPTVKVWKVLGDEKSMPPPPRSPSSSSFPSSSSEVAEAMVRYHKPGSVRKKHRSAGRDSSKGGYYSPSSNAARIIARTTAAQICASTVLFL